MATVASPSPGPVAASSGMRVSPAVLLVTVFSLLAAFLVALFGLGDILFQDVRVAPKELFGGELPRPLRVHAGYRAPGGTIGEFVDPPSTVSVGLVTTSVDSSVGSLPPIPTGGEKLIQAVREFRMNDQHAAWFPPLLLKYASAHFDSRRAVPLGITELRFGRLKIPAVKFRVKREQFFVMALFDLVSPGRRERLLMLAMRPDEPVSTERLERVLGLVPKLAL